MLLSKIDKRYVQHNIERFCQGDLLRELEIIEWVHKHDNEISISSRLLPYAVILTQDCDLEQDHFSRINEDRKNEDKFIQSILLCPAYPAQQLREGTHMDALGISMQRLPTEQYKQVKNNNNYRYHFLPAHEDFQVPDLILDFKQYFTAPRDVLYDQFKPCYLASVNEIFRENLSQRFTFYLGRIGEPNLH